MDSVWLNAPLGWAAPYMLSVSHGARAFPLVADPARPPLLPVPAGTGCGPAAANTTERAYRCRTSAAATAALGKRCKWRASTHDCAAPPRTPIAVLILRPQSFSSQQHWQSVDFMQPSVVAMNVGPPQSKAAPRTHSRVASSASPLSVHALPAGLLGGAGPAQPHGQPASTMRPRPILAGRMARTLGAVGVPLVPVPPTALPRHSHHDGVVFTTMKRL